MEYDPLEPVLDPERGELVSERSFTYGDPDEAFARRTSPRSRSTSALERYPGRVLRRRRRLERRWGFVDRVVELPGAVHAPLRGGGCARPAGLEAAPAHPARLRRQLRGQGHRLRLRRPDGARLEAPRRPGALDRGPGGASRRQLGLDGTHDDRPRRILRCRRAARARLRRRRGRRRLHPSSRAGDALPDARLALRCLPRRPRRRQEQGRAHEPLSHRPQPRLRRATAVPRARGDDERGRARLGLDPAELRRRNLVRADDFLPHPVRRPLRLRRLRGLSRPSTRAGGVRRAARGAGGRRGEGRSLGIGVACVVEPSISNMGYITLAQTAAERAQGLPKSGNAEGACDRLAARRHHRPRRDHAAGSGPPHRRRPGGRRRARRPPGGRRRPDRRRHLDERLERRLGQLLLPLRRGGAAAVHLAATKIAAKLRAIAAELLDGDADDVVLREDRPGSARRTSRSGGSPARRTGTSTRCRPGSSPACTRRRSTRRRTSRLRTPTTGSPPRPRTASSSTWPWSRSTSRRASSTCSTT